MVGLVANFTFGILIVVLLAKNEENTHNHPEEQKAEPVEVQENERDDAAYTIVETTTDEKRPQ